MNLWIRSQDKTTIIRPVSISLDNLRTSIFGYYCGDYYKVLGRYKTEERALEVLDEIQNYIIDKNVIYNCNSILTLVNNKSLNDAAEILERVEKTSVYEMPKE